MFSLKPMASLAAALLLFSACNPKTDSNKNEPSTIAQLKSTKPDQKALIDKTYDVSGYFVNDPVPMLVTDLKWTLANTPMPDSVFISLTGPGVDAMMKELKGFYGAKISVSGKLHINPNKVNRELLDYDFECGTVPKVVFPPKGELIIPKFFNICDIYPPICKPGGPFIPYKVALLYSGGYDAYNAHSRYWNDLVFMYKTLINKYGYNPANIIVVYKDGTAATSDMPVNYPASLAGLTSAVNDVKTRITGKPNNKVFVFTTNHGGGYLASSSSSAGATPDSNNDEPETTNKQDECLYYYGQPNNTLLDDVFAGLINSIGANQLITVHEPCFSGGQLWDLRGAKRVNISAASEFEYSWGGGPADHDIFSYYFTAALNKADAYGVAVNADTNGDNKISLLEAFLYAKTHDTSAEHPQLEDNADGIGSNTPSSSGSGDGVYANTVFL